MGCLGNDELRCLVTMLHHVVPHGEDREYPSPALFVISFLYSELGRTGDGWNKILPSQTGNSFVIFSTSRTNSRTREILYCYLTASLTGLRQLRTRVLRIK